MPGEVSDFIDAKDRALESLRTQLQQAQEERDRAQLAVESLRQSLTQLQPDYEECKAERDAAEKRGEAVEVLVRRTVDFARSPMGGTGNTTNFEIYTDAGQALIEDMEAYLTPAEAQEEAD